MYKYKYQEEDVIEFNNISSNPESYKDFTLIGIIEAISIKLKSAKYYIRVNNSLFLVDENNIIGYSEENQKINSVEDLYI